jgi:nucleoside phosphorylase
MTRRRLDDNAYTVAVVCALRCEINAARALLDAEHERLSPAPSDENSYILGQMGGHNVAIVFPGSGSYGANAIARATTHMVRTFRNIRFGLMVGIGGLPQSHQTPLTRPKIYGLVTSLSVNQKDSTVRTPAT